LAFTTSAAAANSVAPLFRILRSKNANVVHYDALLLGAGFDPASPLDVYWRMHAERGQREELSFLEQRLAYGHRVRGRVSETGFTFILVACRDREIRVTRVGEGARAVTRIRGEFGILESVFVQTDEAGALPRVVYVELRGRSARDSTPLTERLNP
jgi:hypothetical protein